MSASESEADQCMWQNMLTAFSNLSLEQDDDDKKSKDEYYW